jgi:hypothetical protein
MHSLEHLCALGSLVSFFLHSVHLVLSLHFPSQFAITAVVESESKPANKKMVIFFMFYFLC